LNGNNPYELIQNLIHNETLRAIPVAIHLDIDISNNLSWNMLNKSYVVVSDFEWHFKSTSCLGKICNSS